MNIEGELLGNNRVIDVNFDDFDEHVLTASQQYPVLVDFWADWCPPCITLAPVLEKVVYELGQTIALAKLEVDAGENMKLAGKYAVRGFPTVILFQSGVEKGRFSSMQSATFIENFIIEHL